jgi:hypothetical protein
MSAYHPLRTLGRRELCAMCNLPGHAAAGLMPRRRGKHGHLGFFGSAARAFEPRPNVAQGPGSERPSHLEAVQRVAIATTSAFDLQLTAKAGKIGDGTDVLGGHSPRINV